MGTNGESDPRPGASPEETGREARTDGPEFVTYEGRARRPIQEDTGSLGTEHASVETGYQTYGPARREVDEVAEERASGGGAGPDEGELEVDHERGGEEGSIPPTDRETVPPKRRFPTFESWRSSTTRPPRRPILTRSAALAVLLLLFLSAGTVAGIAFLAGRGSLPKGLDDVAEAATLPGWLSKYDVAVDGASVYVIDGQGRVLRLDASSLEVQAEITDPTGPTGFVPNPPTTCGPKGLTGLESATLRRLWALPGFCRLVAADTGRSGRIAVVLRVGDHGRLCIVVRGRIDHCRTLAFVPTGIGIGPDGTIYVADGKDDRIVSFKSDKGRLKKEAEIKLKKGANPHGDIVVRNGRLYVPVTGGVAVAASNGEGVVRTYRFASSPADIWVSPDGVLFAALYLSDRLVWFSLDSPADRRSLDVVGPVAIDGGGDTGDVFVLTRDRVLNRIDPDTGTIVDSQALSSQGPRTAATVQSVDVSQTDSGYAIHIRVAGGALSDLSLIPVDSTIRDGRAHFRLWQAGIATQVSGTQRGQLAVGIREEAVGDLLDVTVRGLRGADLRGFTMELSPDGQLVTVTVTVPGIARRVAVPNVVGIPQSPAEARIRAKGLAVGAVTRAPSAVLPIGDVIRSVPEAGTMLARGSPVRLVVSTGPDGPGVERVTVPQVAGLRLAEARARLQSTGLRVGSVSTRRSETVAAGRVISSSPGAGARVSQGAAIGLVVSSGPPPPPPPPPPVTVPNVVGKTVNEASGILQGVGLVPRPHIHCSGLSEVVGQAPGGGTVVPRDSVVDLFCLGFSGARWLRGSPWLWT